MTEAIDSGNVICWDDLGTLRDSFGPRKGIQEALQCLTDSGFTQVITTGGMQGHSRRGLQAFKLGSYFKKIFGEGDIGVKVMFGPNRKDYSVVSRSFNIPTTEAPHRMVVVSDMQRDIPFGDMGGLVFVHLEDFNTPATAVAEVLLSMWERGAGSFRNGYEDFFNHPSLQGGGLRVARLDSSLQFMLETQDPYNHGIIGNTPVVRRFHIPPEYQPRLLK